jgi:peptide/nickel transport system permease protein
MTTYIIRRLLQVMFVLILVTIIVFFVMRLLPGDPILMFLTKEDLGQVTPEQIATLKHEFGLDKPMVVQYVNWITGIFRGDLGISITHRTKVINEIRYRLPITFHLGSLALIISIIIGVPAGVISAVRRGGWLDTTITTLSYTGVSAPGFWLGILLIYLFAFRLKILPVFGYTSPVEDFWMSTRQVIMPIFCLSVFALASAARQTRSSMLEVLHQDYIRTARSKGLTSRVVVMRHGLKNGLIPVVTVIGMMLREIVGGSVVIEMVFNIPGMGRLAVESLLSKDYAMVQGVVLFITTAVVLANLLVELSYGWLDPRIRYA